jgi:hypothetical protein
LSSKGSANLSFQTNTFAQQQLVVSHTASAVNFAQVTGAATGGAPTFSSQGSDTNINMSFVSKGSGGFRFFSQAGGARQFQINNTASAVNYPIVTGAITGAGPVYSVDGSDTNIGMTLTTKGTGALSVNTGGGEQVRISQPNADTNNGFLELRGSTTSTNGNYITASTNLYVSASSGNAIQFFSNGAGNTRQVQFAHTASAVNYVQVTGAATGAYSVISGQGSDTNTGLIFQVKGTAYYRFSTGGSSTNEQLRVLHTASTANRFELTGAAAGNAPVFSVAGSDTNIDIALTPKGTGKVRFGTFTADMTLVVQGYVEIKDSSGTIRKLAVIA